MQATSDHLIATENGGGKIRENILRDIRYPLHKIADRILPYLRVLQDQFHPEKVVIFGSYAYGNPDQDSDVDILVVKPILASRVKDKVAIRSAWWPLLLQKEPLSFDLMLTSPQESEALAGETQSYLSKILTQGIRVL